MATQSYEELIASATKIKNNELPESNTHDVVGDHLVQMATKAQEEYNQRVTGICEYNVSKQFPTGGIEGSNQYTLELALQKVPTELRQTVGLKCSFLGEDGTLESWEYQGGTFTDMGSWLAIGGKEIAELFIKVDKQYIFSNPLNKRSNLLTKAGYFDSILDAAFNIDNFDPSKEYGLFFGSSIFADSPFIQLYTLDPLSSVLILSSTGDGDLLLFKDAANKSYVLIDRSKLDPEGNYSINKGLGVDLNKRLFYNEAFKEMPSIKNEISSINSKVELIENRTINFTDLTTGSSKLKGVNFVKELYIPNKEDGKVYWIDWVIRLAGSYGHWFGISKGSSIGADDKVSIGIAKFPDASEEEASIIQFEDKFYAVIDWSKVEMGYNSYSTANVLITDYAFDKNNSPIISSLLVTNDLSATLEAKISEVGNYFVDVMPTSSLLTGNQVIKEIYLYSDVDFELYDYCIRSIARNNESFGYYLFIMQYTKGETTPDSIYITTKYLKNENVEETPVLPLYLHSNQEKQVGYVVVDWSSLEVGRNYNVVLRWNIKSEKISLKNCPIINSYIEDLKQNEEIDKIKEAIPTSDSEVIVADKLYAVVGDTLQLFYKGIFNALNLNDYEVRVLCDKGKAYPRYYEFTPTAGDVGEVNITFSLHKVVDIANLTTREVCTKTSKIIISNKLSNPADTVNILHVGDSTIGGGSWPREIKRRFSGTGGSPEGLELTNVNVCGRLTGTYEGVNFGWEGAGGWTWSTYIKKGVKATRFNVTGVSTLKIGEAYRAENGHEYEITEINVTEGTGNIRCTDKYLNPVDEDPAASGTLTRIWGTGDETIAYTSFEIENFSPFINPDTGEVDFQPYADKYCNGRIDVLITSLGINSIFGLKQDLSFLDGILNDAKIFIRKYHEQFPNGKFGLSTIQMPSQNGGFAANYGASTSAIQRAYERNVFALNKAYQNLANEEEFSSYVYIIDNASQVDPDYSYPTEDKKVNMRTDITEKVGTNAVHFTAIGANMIADSVYRFISNIVVGE